MVVVESSIILGHGWPRRNTGIRRIPTNIGLTCDASLAWFVPQLFSTNHDKPRRQVEPVVRRFLFNLIISITYTYELLTFIVIVHTLYLCRNYHSFGIQERIFSINPNIMELILRKLKLSFMMNMQGLFMILHILLKKIDS